MEIYILTPFLHRSFLFAAPQSNKMFNGHNDQGRQCHLKYNLVLFIQFLFDIVASFYNSKCKSSVFLRPGKMPKVLEKFGNFVRRKFGNLEFINEE